MAREKHVSDPNPTYGGMFQASGFTSANQAEVEANTKALRAVLRGPGNLLFRGRYANAIRLNANFGAARVDLIVGVLAYYGTGLAQVRTVTGSIIQTVIPSGIVGLNRLEINRGINYDTAGPTDVTFTILTPGGGFRSNQDSPCAWVWSNSGFQPTVTWAARTVDTNPLSAVEQSQTQTAGKLPSKTNARWELWDAYASGPINLRTFEGIEIAATFQGGSTNNTVHYSFDLVWDEFDMDDRGLG